MIQLYCKYITPNSECKYVRLILNGQNLFKFRIGELLAEYAKTSRENYKNKFDAKQGIGNYCIAYSEEFKSWNRAHILDWKMVCNIYSDNNFR